VSGVSDALEILATDPATLQDLGRIGHLALASAFGRSTQAPTLGQRLLGNGAGSHPAGSPAIEATLGGLVVRAHGDLLACLTGAPTPATVDGQVVAMGSLIPLRNKQVLTLGKPSLGLRTYLSVRGGLVV
jgi:allophanate hydrolase subunit 2